MKTDLNDGTSRRLKQFFWIPEQKEKQFFLDVVDLSKLGEANSKYKYSVGKNMLYGRCMGVRRIFWGGANHF